MNIFKKTILGTLSSALLLITSTHASAASFDIKLGVDAKAGCVLGSADFNFGNINQATLAKATVSNELLSLTQNLNVRCSQGTTFVLTQKGFDQDSGYTFNTMYLNGTQTALNHSMIKYLLKTKLVVADNKFNITSRPSSENLGLNSVSGYSYGLGVKATTGSQFVLPILAVIHNTIGFENLSGNYNDTVVYTVTF